MQKFRKHIRIMLDLQHIVTSLAGFFYSRDSFIALLYCIFFSVIPFLLHFVRPFIGIICFSGDFVYCCTRVFLYMFYFLYAKAVCHFLGLHKLILNGRISEAIETTQSLYPGLLDRNLELLFKLKCRQFIEMVTGCDSEVKPSAHSPTRSALSSPCSSPARTLSHTTLGATSNLATNGYSNDLSQQKTVDSAQEATGNGIASDTGNGVMTDIGNGVLVDEDMEMEEIPSVPESMTMNAKAVSGPSSSNITSQFYSSPARGIIL